MPFSRDRASLVAFFAVVFGVTWPLQLPAILAERGVLAGPAQRYAPLVVLGYFVPTFAALLLARRDLGGEGVGVLLRRFAPRPIAARWYALALVHAAALLAAGMAVARAIAGAGAGSFFYPPAAAAQVAAMVVVPFTEQIAWRGFAYPRLEARVGPLGASLAVGAGWALFHEQKQAFLGAGMPLGVAAWLLLLMVAGTVVYTWFQQRTGSMLLVVAANAGAYLGNATEALPANVTPLAAQAMAYAVLAIALVLADPAPWRRSA